MMLLALIGPRLDALEPGQAKAAEFREDRIIIRAAPGANADALNRLHANLGSSVARKFTHGRGAEVVHLRKGTSAAAALAAFRASGLVEFAEPDYLLQALITPNDFQYHNQDQWNLHNTGVYGGVPGADIMAEAGWDLQRDAGNIIVAVLDSGVRYTHEDLAANMWVNPGESGVDAVGRDKRTNGVDDDANGYVDDVHGINVLNGSGDPMDDWGHGTHVAGIVGGVGNNSVGIAGVAWRVKIMACKFISASAQYSVSDAITSLEYARAKGARIVTASWGGYAFTSTALRDAITTLRNQGIIMTAAAGNDNSNNDTMPLYPASYDLDNIVAVAATDRTDARAGYSNYGSLSVDLGAPGAPVFSTWAGSDRDYRYNEGTSMAAPHVAGACALLWARFPTETHQQIIQRILTTVDVLPGLTGRTRSGGRLNLAAALGSGTPPPPPPPPPAVLAAPSNLTANATSSTTVSLTWTDNTATETGFEIQRSNDNVTFVASGTTGSNSTSASVTGLNAATTYYFRVRAVQDTTTSAYSNTASATTQAAPPPPTPPAAPTNLIATATSATTVALSWTDNATNETGFEIQRSTDNVNFVAASTAAANATSASVGSLTASTTYYFRVRSIRDSLTSAFSNTASATTQTPPPPPPPPPPGSWQSVDVGAVSAAGSSSESAGTVSLRGSGADIWEAADEFHYRYQSWTGDGEITARLTGLTNTNGWAKAGVMFRETLAANSRNVLMCATVSNGSAFQRRTTTGAQSVSTTGTNNATLPRWLRLVRSGNTFTAFESANGTRWTQVGTMTLALPSTIYVGLAVTSHNDGVMCTATFDNIATSGGGTPPPPVTISPPTGLSATASSASQINLSWTDTSGNETGFEVSRSTDQTNWTVVTTTAPNAITYSDIGRSASTTYHYRVRAVAGTSFSTYSNTASATTLAGTTPGTTWFHGDVGSVGIAGSNEAAGNTITVRGSGADIWETADGFRFVYRQMSGDCTVEAQVSSMTNTNGWAKAGVMIRESLDANSRNVAALLTPTNGVTAQARTTTGASTVGRAGRWGAAAPYWVRLVRTANRIVAFESSDGITWNSFATYDVTMSASVLVGFAVTSHNNSQLCTAVFTDPFIR